MLGTDIDTLLAPQLARILSDDDRVLYEEAVRAAQGGAHRAAYVMLWLGCVESIKRKFREQALRDKSAGRISAELDGRERLGASADAYLLDQARAYGWLSEADWATLAHIYHMRAVYSRPAEEPPGAVTVVAAANAVVDIVLSRPAELRQGYLRQQLRLLTTDPSFIDDVPESTVRYADEVFDKAAPELHVWLIRQLCRALEAINGDPEAAPLVRRSLRFARAFIRRGAPAIFHSWDVIADLGKHPTSLCEVLAVPELFTVLEPQTQDLIVGQLLVTQSRRARHLKELERLHSSGALSARQVERFVFAVESMALTSIAAIGIRPVYYAGSLTRELRCGDWYRQNLAVDVLRGIGARGMASLPAAMQRALSEHLWQAAAGKSREAVRLVDELTGAPGEWPSAFVEGVSERAGRERPVAISRERERDEQIAGVNRLARPRILRRTDPGTTDDHGGCPGATRPRSKGKSE